MDELITVLRGRLKTWAQAIRSLIDTKLDKTAQAADSAKLGGQTAAQLAAGVMTTVNAKLDPVAGSPGQLPFFDKENVAMSFAPGPMLIKMRMAATDDALTALKNSTQTFADVFNTWQRISHGSTDVYPFNSSELSSWAYDSATDAITATVNSASLMGLISPYKFDEYTFDVILKSTGADDDVIGLALAFKRQNGLEYTLCLLASTGGYTSPPAFSSTALPNVQIVVQPMKTAANGMQVLAAQELGIARGNWNASGAAYASGIRVKATRTKAGALNVRVLQADGSEWPNPVNFNVTLPTMFQSACQIGYVALSQPNASYSNITVPQLKTDIIDTRDNTVWRWNNTTSAWVNAGKTTDSGVMLKGRMYKNIADPYTAYWMDEDGNFFTLGGPGKL